MKPNISGSRAVRLVAALGLVSGVAACSNLLDVTNPATFGDESLNSSILAPQLINGVVTRVQAGYDDLALNSAIITDEAVSGNNFETVHDVDLRLVTKINSTDVYPRIELARAAADSFAARLTRVYGDSASSSLGLARIQAYGAFAYVLAGEYLCDSPVDPSQPAITPDSMLKISVSRARDAIATATAHRAKTGAATAAADSLLAFARVTGARAALDLGDFATAASLASLVPAGFQLYSYYDVNNSSNIFQSSTTGGNRNLGVDVTFRNLNDTRVRHSATGSTGHDQSTILCTPFQPESCSGFPSTTAFALGTAIRISSGLEAQYIRAEAEGPTAANIAFVEGRRLAFPSATAATPTTAANFMDNLRDQRRRDFFLDGHRLGDLRRYIKLYNLDLFPKGAHPNTTRGGTYGSSTCFPPTDAEIVGNPNYTP